uniref:Uncharacterized protein n=1 Tax=Arundo donax TaxID=35708 RepID=A0A0A9EP59_ARUDO
MLAVCQQWMT